MTSPAMTRIGRLFERLKRENRKGLIAYLTAGDPSPAAHARAGGGHGARRRRPDRTRRAVQRPDRRWSRDPARRRARPQGGHHAGRRARDRAPDSRHLRGSAAAVHVSQSGLALWPGTPRRRRGGRRHRWLPAHRRQSWKRPRPTWTPCTATASTRSSWPRPPARERRIKLVAQYSTGFVYLVSRTGVTGEQDSLSASVAPLVEAVRAATDLPLAVGFGISKPEHVAELGRLVEAVVVGSAFVRLIEQNADDPALEAKLEAFTRELKSGFGAHA